MTTFLFRRWRRIFPTYWTSIALVVGLAIAYRVISDGSPREVLTEPGLKWFAVLTLTQTFIGGGALINPVYWSLCYEEQFYLVIATAMLLAPSRRPAFLMGVTVLATAAYGLQSRVTLPQGLFIDQWLSFAVGLAVFGWFDDRYGRSWSMTIFSLAILAEVVTRRLDLAIAIAAALFFTALRKHDGRLSAAPPVAVLASVGTISYSLYLIHVPIVSRVELLARRGVSDSAAWWPPIALVAAASAIAGAAIFHRFVEKRFQNAARRIRSASVPTVAVA